MAIRWKKKIIGAILCAVAAVAVGSGLAWLNPWQKTQEQLSDLLYYERPSKHPIVIIGIDSKSVSSDQGLGRMQDWPRSNYAKVLANILKYHPAAVGLDIFFRSPSSGISGVDLPKVISEMSPDEIKAKYIDAVVHPADQQLSDLIKTNQNVFVISSAILNQDLNGGSPAAVTNPPYTPASVFYSDLDHVGHNGILAGVSGVYYKALPLLTNAGRFFPSLPMEMALNYLGVKNASYDINENKLTVKAGTQVMDIPLDNFQMLINYTRKTMQVLSDAYAQGNIIYIPFVDAYNDSFPENFDSNLIKDKLVLIGVWYRDGGDSYPTAIDPQNPMFGVAIHAQTIQTILDQAWLYNQSLPWQVATMVILVALTLAMVFGLRLQFALPGAALLLGIYYLVLAPLCFRGVGVILNLVYPPASLVMAAIIGYAYQTLSESRQKIKMAAALGTYVNAGVAENVLASEGSGLEKVGRKAEITVIFTDIRSFTTISENLQPQSLVALLNEYFEVMAGVVIANGGIVDKYEGDALMAFFEGPGHAVKAAGAALGMRAELPKLMAKWKNDPPLPGGEAKPEIDFRVGVSSGEAVVGNFGSSQHIQYTVMGDIVNLGSRLESANKKYQTNVMVAEATFEAIKDQFECRYLDNIEVKGKNKPVKIYQLLCEKGQLSREDQEMISAYNVGIQLYFDRKFAEAKEHFEKNVLGRWPRDYLANVYAARAQKCVMFPPDPDWDFVFKMESK